MPLIPQSNLSSPDYTGPEWHRDFVRELGAKITPPSDFPCTFSQNAWRRELVDFIFLEDASASDLAACRAALLEYIAQSRLWNGRVNAARPLVVGFSKDAADFDNLADYHAFGWKILQNWHDHDIAPWPDGVSKDPTQAFWSMCFDGMQLFVNMSCPAHDKRKSRNLGKYLAFIVNPRERFDIVAPDTPEGWRVRNIIRSRCAAYDGQPHAPELGSYQKGEIEWSQYGLSDVNGQTSSTCPFEQRKG